MNMKSLLASLALLLLTACAGEPYQRVSAPGDGSYYLASTPADRVYAYPPNNAMSSWGWYPWWGYSYYSPNFYPHYFPLYVSPWYGFGDPWYPGFAQHPYWPPPHHGYRYVAPGVGAVVAPAPPIASVPAPPAGEIRVPAERGRRFEERALQREFRQGQAYRSQPPAAGREVTPRSQPRVVPDLQPGMRSPALLRGPGANFPSPGASSGMPSPAVSAPVAAGPSGPGPEPGMGRGRERSPDRHDQ